MSELIEKIKNSNSIYQIAFQDMPINNIKAKNYISTCRLLMGTIDLRARSGTFTTPYRANLQPGYELFKLRYIDNSLSDLYDARALEIFNYAKKNNKKINICWSGGIDSTSVLTAFLKNLSKNDLEILNVLSTGSSIIENYDFYKNFISQKIKCSSINSIILNDDFLNKNILLTGDPADCIFGCSIGMYRDFINRQEHLQPWKNHYKKMIEKLDMIGKEFSPNTATFGSWYVKKISDNLEEVRQADYLNTIADWWWWAYFNFRWQCEVERMFINLRPLNSRESISESNIKDFQKYTFFNTENFQLWSYSNIKKLITDDITQHKAAPKKYITEFTKNEIFQKNKVKVALPGPNHRLRSKIELPYFYDKNWQGYTKTHEIHEIFKMLLEKYNG